VLRSLYIALIYFSFLALGTAAPFIFGLGYVWVDTFTPQDIAYIILPDIPVSLIMAAATIGGYIVLDRKSPPSVNPVMILTLLLAVWVTLSTALWAVVPASAWSKWDYAFKTIVFSAFIPFAFRSRIQIESFLQIYLFSLVIQFLPVGIKTLISGGGYGVELGLVSGNAGLSEGSTLAAVSLMIVPIILYLRAHTQLLPKSRLTDLGYIGLVVGAVAAAMGTYERTALVGMLVLGCGIWLRARRKVLGAVIGAVVVSVIVLSSSATWNERISTTSDYNQETSALGRLLVWQWTLDFVSDHPQGGGFNSYQIDRIEFPGTATHPESTVVTGKAFHSIYFEMLGEQGWVGLGLFLGLIGASLVSLQAVARRTRHAKDMLWCRDLAYALQVSLLTLLACGAFIGIAFQPMLYYLFALSTCLRQHVRQVERLRPLGASSLQPAKAVTGDRVAAKGAPVAAN
jgi:putative inorganic carbon (hco3(-)) transporter